MISRTLFSTALIASLIALSGCAVMRGQETTGAYVDMFAADIVEPAKVTRSALQNAASIAALFLTTEVLVADKP